MSSLPFVFGSAVAGRSFKVSATKGGSVAKEEKSFFDWLLGKITKDDQFYETDPILQKTEKSSGGGTVSGTTGGRKGTVLIPSKKKNNGAGGGLGGLFAKKQ